MHEHILPPNLSKAETYKHILPHIRALIEPEPEMFMASLANVCALLKETFNWLWVGFYLVDRLGENLLLAPFQGPIACTRIAKGRGVCGQAWAQAQTIIVADVAAYPDHIACSSRSQSEIVIPLFNKQNHIFGVLDIDADSTACFDKIDAHYLEQICAILGEVPTQYPL